MTFNAQVHPSPRRLLLVDDDDAFRQALAEALEKRGFEVLASAGLEDAAQLAQRWAPQYAVVDLRLGSDSGLPLVERLVARDAGMRIVVLTGYASIATAVEAIKLGATHYLSKPATPEELLDALERPEGDASIDVEPRPMSVRRHEWEHLQRVLRECHGNVSAAARALGMHRRTLQRKLNKRPVRR